MLLGRSGGVPVGVAVTPCAERRPGGSTRRRNFLVLSAPAGARPLLRTRRNSGESLQLGAAVAGRQQGWGCDDRKRPDRRRGHDGHRPSRGQLRVRVGPRPRGPGLTWAATAANQPVPITSDGVRRLGMSSGAEALDRADFRDPPVRTVGGEHRLDRARPLRRRPRRDRGRRFQDRNSGCALPPSTSNRAVTTCGGRVPSSAQDPQASTEFTYQTGSSA
jgi:hypothetical protein